MGTHHQVPGLLGGLHPRGLQAPQMPSPHAYFSLLSPSKKRRAGKTTRGRCVLLWDDCVPFISYDLKVRRHGRSLAQEKRQNQKPLVLRIQVMEELISDGWSFLSHLQKSHKMETQTHMLKFNPDKTVKDLNTKNGNVPTNFSSSFREPFHVDSL